MGHAPRFPDMNEALNGVFDALHDRLATGDLRMRQAGEVARDYAELLGRSSAEAAEVRDVHELPFAKDAIRHALLMLLAALSTPAQREPLRLAYLRLADWQPAEPPVDAVDLTSARNSRDPLELASRLAASRVPVEDRRRAAVVRERTRLVEELRREGYG
jgi:hypothetical protein